MELSASSSTLKTRRVVGIKESVCRYLHSTRDSPDEWPAVFILNITEDRYFEALCIPGRLPMPGIFPLELLSCMKTIHTMEISQHL